MDERERPIEVERETTVINTGGDRGGGGGGTMAVVLVVLVLAILAFLFFGGYLQSAADEVNVDVNVGAPKVELPDVNIDATPAQPANKSGN